MDVSNAYTIDMFIHEGTSHNYYNSCMNSNVIVDIWSPLSEKGTNARFLSFFIDILEVCTENGDGHRIIRHFMNL